MKKISKRFRNLKQLVEKESYLPEPAIELLKKTATAKFNECAEVHISLNINPKFADQQLRTTIILPNGTGQDIKMALLLPDEKLSNEYKSLVYKMGSEDLLNDISQNKLDFDILITTPEMMPKLAKFGRILGPKNLMPSPKSGTVTTDIIATLNQFRKGKIEYRADKTGIVHSRFGKMSFSDKELLENLISFYNSVLQNKPSGVKGKYVKSFYISTTMGPSIQIDYNDLKI